VYRIACDIRGLTAVEQVRYSERALAAPA